MAKAKIKNAMGEFEFEGELEDVLVLVRKTNEVSGGGKSVPPVSGDTGGGVTSPQPATALRVIEAPSQNQKALAGNNMPWQVWELSIIKSNKGLHPRTLMPHLPGRTEQAIRNVQSIIGASRTKHTWVSTGAGWSAEEDANAEQLINLVAGKPRMEVRRLWFEDGFKQKFQKRTLGQVLTRMYLLRLRRLAKTAPTIAPIIVPESTARSTYRTRLAWTSADAALLRENLHKDNHELKALFPKRTFNAIKTRANILRRKLGMGRPRAQPSTGKKRGGWKNERSGWVMKRVPWYVKNYGYNFEKAHRAACDEWLAMKRGGVKVGGNVHPERAKEGGIPPKQPTQTSVSPSLLGSKPPRVHLLDYSSDETLAQLARECVNGRDLTLNVAMNTLQLSNQYLRDGWGLFTWNLFLEQFMYVADRMADFLGVSRKFHVTGAGTNRFIKYGGGV